MLVSATSTPVTRTREEAVEIAESVETAEAVEIAEVDKDNEQSKSEYPNLARVLCIRYPITFRKKSVSMLTLFDLESEVNAIHPTLAWKVGLPMKPTNQPFQ